MENELRNFVEEYETPGAGHEKTAFNWEHPLVGAGLAVAGAVATPLIMSGAMDGYDAVKNSVMRARGFKRMLEKNPDLRERPAEQLKAQYSTFHKMSPTIMGDPTAAAGIMRSSGMYDGLLAPTQLSELAKAEHSLQRPMSPSRVSAMNAASTAIAGLPMDMSRLKETQSRAGLAARELASYDTRQALQQRSAAEQEAHNLEQERYWEAQSAKEEYTISSPRRFR